MVQGSSPHSRGTHEFIRKKQERPRIIPAFAGNTLSYFIFPLFVKDHPRIRGEHNGTTYYVAAFPGSSPHSRGTLSDNANKMGSDGIIPAFAGNTPQCTVVLCVCEDHPRIRGEHRRPSQSVRRRLGSSPHSRGTLQIRAFKRNRTGIIPAFAGNTLKNPHKIVIS